MRNELKHSRGGVAAPTVALALAAIATLGGLGYSSPAMGQFQSIMAIDASYTSGSASYGRNALTTVGDYQLATYYDVSGFVKVGRRKKLVAGGWSRWTFRTTQFTSFNLAAGHNVSTIGVDGAGYLHLSWGVHNNRLQYSRSTTSVLNDNAFAFVDDTVGNNASTGVLGYEIPQSGNSVTYPEWFTAPGGDLILTFRANGVSGTGEYQLTRWNNTTRSWSGVRAGSTNDSTPQSSPQPWIDNDFLASQNPPDASAYIHGVTWDGTGRMHTSWAWRTGSNSISGFTDYQSNHNLMYAYSDDQGLTWRLTNGTVLQRNGNHDIDENNATPIKSLPEGSSLINQGDMTVDLQNRPVIASWWAPNAGSGNHLRQYMLQWYDGTTWRTSQVSNRATENGNQRISEINLGNWAMTRPSVVVDDAGRVIVIYRDSQRGNVITAAYTEAANRDVWTTLDLSDEAPAGGEPAYDRGRWASDKVLSFSAKSSATSQLSVYEFDWGSYFAPQTGSFWNAATGGDWGGAGVWAAAQPNGSAARANFGGGGTPLSAPATVTLTGTKTAGRVVFNSQAAGFTLGAGAGGVLALDNGASAAQVRVMAGAHTIAVPVTMNSAGADFQNYTSEALVISGNISGTGRLTKSGTGHVILSGSGTWTGGTTINAGVLQIGNGGTAGSLPAGAVTINLGGLAFGRSDSFTLTNVFTGVNGKVIQNGTGTLTFAGANTFGTSARGGLVVNSGMVRRGNASTFSIGILVMINGGMLDMNGNMSMVKLGSDSDSTGVITDLSAGAGTTTLTVNSTVSSDFYGRITDGPAKTLTLVKSGSSSLTLRSSNAFTGNVSLQNGVLIAYDDHALGSGTITMTGGASITELRVQEATLGNRIIFNGGNPVATVGSIRGDQQVTNGSTLTGAIDINADVSNAGGHFAGPVSANSGVALTLAGPVTQGAGASGVIVRSGNVRFSGGGDIRALRLDNGLYSVGADNGIPTNAVVTLGTYGVSSFDLKGRNQTLAGIIEATATYAVTVTNTSTTLATLTLNTAADNIYDGVLAGNLNLTKAGLATVTLTSTNSHGGITTITGGKLSVSADRNLGAVPASATAGEVVIDGGTLLASATFTLAANRGVALGPSSGNGSGTIEVAAGQTLTYAGNIANNGTGSHGLIKAGTGLLLLGGSGSFSGDTILQAGTLQLTGALAVAGSTLDYDNQGGTLSFGSLTAATLGGLKGSQDLSLPTNFTLTVGGSGASATYSGVLGGSGARLVKAGTGTLTLAATNAFGGGVTINGGVVSVAADTNLGAAPGVATPAHIILNAGTLAATGSFTINSLRGIALGPSSGNGAGSIDVATGSTVTYAGVIANNGAGIGSLVKTGSGRLILSASNTFSGTTTLLGGTLVLASEAPLGPVPASLSPGMLAIDGATLAVTSGFTVSANRGITVGPATGTGTATFDVPTSQTLIVPAPITDNGSGTGGITKTGAGFLRLTSPSSTFSGKVVVAGASAGGVEFTSIGNIGQPSALGVGSASPDSITLSGFGNLRYTGTAAAASNRAVTLTGSGYIQNTGTASLTLNGNINISVASAIFQIRPASTTATIRASGIISGPGSLLKNDAGLGYVDNASNSFAGNLICNSGTLDVSSFANAGVNSSIGAGSTITFQGTASTLRYSGLSASSTNRTINVTATSATFTSTATAGPLTLTGSIVGSGSLTLAGSVGAGAIPPTFGDGTIYLSTPAYALTGNLAVNGARLVTTQPLRSPTATFTVTGSTSTALLVPSPTAINATGQTLAAEFGAITVNSGALLAAAATDRTESKAAVIITSGLSISGGGTFDLGNNDLIVRGGAASLASIRDSVATGALRASAAAAGPSQYLPHTTLAVFVNETDSGGAYFSTYDGAADLTVNDLILKYTYIGDTNLDGALDGNDLANIIEGFSTGQSGWRWGDVDNSGGPVDLTDLTAFFAALSYYQSNTPTPLGDGQGGGGSAGAVPEPHACVLLALVPFASRRRR